MKARRHMNPFREADRLLAESGFQTPPVDVESLVAHKGLSIYYLDASDDVSGLLLRKGKQVAIGVNNSHHRNRQRFTIAHELGHWILHLSTANTSHSIDEQLHVDDQLVYFRDGTSSKASEPVEIQANSFAAALLMPRASLLADLAGQPIDVNDDRSIRRLARRYQVSHQALTLRLVNLEFVAGWSPENA